MFDPKLRFDSPDPDTKKNYKRELLILRRNFPFSSEYIGEINPYTEQIITDAESYDEYLRQYALRIIYESKKNEDRQKHSSALLHMENEYKRKEKYQRKKLTGRTILFIFLLFGMLFIPSPLSKSEDIITALPTSCPTPTPIVIYVYSTAPPDTSSDSDSSAHSSDSSNGGGFGDPVVSDSYIGNAKTGKFHLPSCNYLPEESNQIVFHSRTEAIDAGYAPCKKCNP